MRLAVAKVAAPPSSDSPLPEPIPLRILYEDPHLLVVDKPPGMVVHPAAGVHHGTLVNALLHRYPGFAHRFSDSPLRPGIVHRLDKDTSGCLAVALDKPAQLALAKSFAGRDVRKTYLALVQGHPRDAQGEILAPIGRHPIRRERMAVVARGGREAITHYRVVRQGWLDKTPVSLLEVEILTGRTHQIRVHLGSVLRTPVLGDATYGHGPRSGIAAPRQLLHAWKLALPHPVTRQTMAWESPIPGDFRPLLAALAVRS
jgi:23S rRNA pseudouridine1911/1915/1917 synthase